MRSDDSSKATRSYFRSGERVFAQNGKWFFFTREGESGPFATKAEALAEVARFVKEKRDLAHFQKLREARQRSRAGSPGNPLPGATRAASLTVLALLPMEDTELVVGNLALERRR